MGNAREKIIRSLKKVTGEKEIRLEVPEKEEFGDYCTNIVMQLASRVKEQASERVEERKDRKTKKKIDPRILAKQIVQKLSKDKQLSEIVSKIEVVGAGFINIWLSTKTLANNLEDILKKGEDYGNGKLGKGKRIMFEFGQPNTHKIPHIGHLFSYIYGSSMSNVLRKVGYTIFKANYQGDIGLHVAKCLWAYQEEKPRIPELLEEKVNLLQKMYQLGSKAYDEDESAKKEIEDLNIAIYSCDPAINLLWKETREWSIEYYKEFEKRLGINFNRYYFESEVYERGKDIVEMNIGKIFKKSEGAIIFEGSKFGLHDRVFLTKFGTPTYEAKDMYLQTLKYQEWPFDLLIITTANEQNEYFKVIFRALEELNPELKDKLIHLGFGMINLKTGKMASRTGEIIGGIELVNKVVGVIGDIVKDRGDITGDEKRKIMEIVGISAVKYSFLKSNYLQDVKFDIKESVSTQGNSGPYLQYTYARTQSVLLKAVSLKLKAKNRKNFQFLATSHKLNSEELALLRKFIHFPEVIEEVAKNYAPNLLCNYLYNLAQKYNTFYNKYRILNIKSKRVEERKSRSCFRLAMTQATGTILKNGLNLLGIQAPERM